MNISRISGVDASAALQSVRGQNSSSFGAENTEAASGLNPTDQLDFSAEAQAILENGEANSTDRTARIADIRRQIADGSYDTPERLSLALDRYLDVLG